MEARDDSGKARSPRGQTVDGKLLRFLRKSHGYTQEQAATLAGVSDKLVRKAESGGPIQPSSIRALANVYGQSFRTLVAMSTEISAAPESSGRAAACERLAELILGSWNDPWDGRVAEMVSEGVLCHCDDGLLVGRRAWLQRLKKHRSGLGSSMLIIEQIAGDDLTAASRWRLFSELVSPRRELQVRQGTTSIRMVQDTIEEVWDFLDPECHRFWTDDKAAT